jgi:hypothetical protein
MFYVLWLWLCATPPGHAIDDAWKFQKAWQSRYEAIHKLFEQHRAER